MQSILVNGAEWLMRYWHLFSFLLTHYGSDLKTNKILCDFR